MSLFGFYCFSSCCFGVCGCHLSLSDLIVFKGIIMRRSALFFALLSLLLLVLSTSCGDKKPVEEPVLTDSIAADTSVVDTMEQIISEQTMPKAADELFDDFFFNFAASRKVQYHRIKFPLKMVSAGNVEWVDKDHWNMEHFFMEQGFYTLIVDNMRQLKSVKDTTINNVVVEKIYLDDGYVCDYAFDRLNGRWMLTSVTTAPLSANPNASFLSFYRHFSTDSAFQQQSLNDPVDFSGPDPDDDFGSMTGEIVPESWPAFAPELPSGVIYNIRYGKNHVGGSQKLFLLRGISNGMEMQLTFRNVDGKWLLTRLVE